MLCNNLITTIPVIVIRFMFLCELIQKVNAGPYFQIRFGN